MKTMTIVCLTILVAGLTLSAHATGAAEDQARPIIQESGVTGGLIVHLGCGDGKLTAALRGNESFLVQGLDADVTQARANIRAAGLYGPVTAECWSGGALPYVDNIVRLLIVGDHQPSVTRSEMLRVLCPGGVAVTLAPSLLTLRKPWPKEMDTWPQYMPDGDGNPVNDDTLAGPPRSVRWHCGPQHQRSHNWNVGLAGMVTDAGRIFAFVDEGPAGVHDPSHPENWHLVARDAFSGVLLWKRPMTDWGWVTWNEPVASDANWSTPWTLNRRSIVLGDRLYVTMQYRTDTLSVLDAATGQTVREIQFSGTPDEIIADNGVIFARIRQLPPPFTGGKWEKFSLSRPDSDLDPAEKEAFLRGPQRANLALNWMKNLPPENITAVDAASGRVLWKAPIRFALVETLAAQNGRVLYRDFDHLVALDANTGKELWRAPCAARYSGNFGRGHAGALLLYQDNAFCTTDRSGLAAFDAATGNELWTSERGWQQYGYFSPVSLRAAHGLIWQRKDMAGFDPATGKQIRRLELGNMLSGKSRCYRQVGAGRYFFDSFWGIQSVDLIGEEHSSDSWIRGMCSFGILPANGLLYVPQEPCNCFMGIRVDGFYATASQLPQADYEGRRFAERLKKGTCFEKIRDSRFENRNSAANEAAWPMYRHDARRSSHAGSPAPLNPSAVWTADLGGELTSPTIANGKVYVGRKDTDEVICLDAATGNVAWHFTAGGPVNTPPTINAGRALFGSADGWVYCLKADDGALIWRFRAAPGPQRIVAMERLESVWPCDGSVVVQGDTLLCAAGRSSFFDGGLFVYALDLATGEVRHHARLDGPWPTREELRNPPKSPMQTPSGFQRDLIVLDGGKTYMNLARFDEKLRPESMEFKPKTYGGLLMGPHLMATGGFLDDSLFHRVGFHYGAMWPGFANVHGGANAGTLVCFDARHGFAARHYVKPNRYPNHDPGGGNLISKELLDAPSVAKTSSSLQRTENPLWEIETPLIIRAIATAPAEYGGPAATVLAVGLPDDNDPEDPLAPYFNRGTPKLISLSAANGETMYELVLPGPPVFDGLAIAEGKLFIATTEGQVLCLGATQ